ncbi:CHRD domain-containing protein [Flavobacterium rhamnosiphilum]|uniref:CHRD domain-containing protein n=1 Tax=Flavobacterium rhamnosiphilum TaxID=2541724 RepID=A0A4R5F7I3_9FLAO|nr:CHRD domain-containing protein [Flavobacterium rhamnosiphilum]TDE43487.1 CHRD domain-containing protein [Flavobacterium rhamnosiphilum]
MRLLIRFLAIAIILSGIVSCDGDSYNDPNPNPNPNSGSTIIYTATLRGANEVPANASTATGTATLRFNTVTKTFTISVTYTGVTATGAHIHYANPGVSGPIAFPFSSIASPITYTSVALNATQESYLNANLYYVNIHSAALPDGEIRGQLIKEGTPAPVIVTLNATLNGMSEVPQNGSMATGTATLTFNNTTKRFSITVTHNVVGANAAHIHNGAVGINGGIVFPLASTSATNYTYTSLPLSTAEEIELRAGRYYVNIHSAAPYTAGEIRGQLIITNPSGAGDWDY